MSIERIERKDGGVVWRVRWRQAGQNRSRVLGRKRDAEAFDAELRRKRRTGELAALDAGKETLAEFGEEWWKLYAEPNLAASTLKVYAILWDTHVLPRLGSLRLREITPSIVTRFRLELEAEGVGRVSIHKAMTLLQGVLQRACEWDRLASNPARAVRKPTAARARAVEPFTPDAVEAIRFWLLERELIRDATLVSVLAYAGPAARRGARADVVRGARAHAARRVRGQRGRGRRDEDAPAPDRAPASAAESGPRRVAPRRGAATRRRTRLPGPRRSAVVACGIQELASPVFPSGDRCRRTQRRTAIRPAPLVRLTPDRRGPQRR